MQVTLAGFNVDYRLIELIRKIVQEIPGLDKDNHRLREYLSDLVEEPLTPETISAAYARISRSEKSIRALRDDARASLSRARRSNEEIVFGFGHASVAEHAVFNLDLTDVSRLTIEELESHRLASYTERSQRYVGLTPEFLVPDEIHAIGLRLEMEDYCRAQFETYIQLQTMLKERFGEERADREKSLQDARYVLPLAFYGQLGMTINARMVEHMVRSFRHSPLAEVQMMGKQLHDEVKKIAPSLIRYTEYDTARVACRRNLQAEVNRLFSEPNAAPASNVSLLHSPRLSEETVTAALAFSLGGNDFLSLKNEISTWSSEERKRFLKKAHSAIEAHDSLRRELELGYFTFSVILSASAFAQLKRHRMATLIKQDYSPQLGVTTPQSVKDVAGESLFQAAMHRSDAFYAQVKAKLPADNRKAAQYVLTNAHRRRVIFQTNARELTHLSRLRLDKHAQWDIRGLAGNMIELAREACPALMQFACGRDEFPDWKKAQEND